ncbi:hypothetical protein [Nocardia sp. NPDC057440]|uniref:hypothetical protein n=1 Tax=Nocardia sp. NPDC057440 TaxID=3346134 RepID=UPI00366BA8BA
MIDNWLGQTIKPGTIVGRGARDGNTSSFKVGKVISVDAEKRTARIEWLLYPAYRPGSEVTWERFRSEHRGTPAVDTLFVLDHKTFGFDFYKEAR